jgi:hypothetical protein
MGVRYSNEVYNKLESTLKIFFKPESILWRMFCKKY